MKFLNRTHSNTNAADAPNKGHGLLLQYESYAFAYLQNEFHRNTFFKYKS